MILDQYDRQRNVRNQENEEIDARQQLGELNDGGDNEEHSPPTNLCSKGGERKEAYGTRHLEQAEANESKHNGKWTLSAHPLSGTIGETYHVGS